MLRFLSWVGDKIADMLDPVCQDKGAVLMGEHNGVIVRLRPIVEADGHVRGWIPDPDEAANADTCLAAAPALALQTSAPPPPLPGGTTTPPFNPAGVPGI